jgi:hypothetical protein
MSRIVPVLAVAGLATLALTACSNTPAPSVADLMPVTVSASPSPDATVAQPEDKPAIHATTPGNVDEAKTTTVSATVKVGMAGSIPVAGANKSTPIEVVWDSNDGVVTTTLPEGIKFAEVPEPFSIVFAAEKPGTAQGTVRFIGPDGTLTGKATAFTVEVTQ